MTAQKRGATDNRTYDWGLVSIVATLLAFGAVMVFSAGFAQGIYGLNNPYYFFIYQLIWIALGTVALIAAARIPYGIWEKWSVPLMGVAVLSLIAVVLFGDETFGSTRTFFGGRVQPSEPAKIAIIIYISAWLASKGERVRDVQVGLLPFAMLMGIITVLLVSQPDISTAFLIVATATIMFFIAGANLKQLALIAAGGAITFWLIIRYSTYAGGRVERFVESFRDPIASNEWQTGQAMRALARGGLTGVGLGNGEAKLPGRLPVSWSDNIFAVIGEELGLLGALLVILLFALLAYRGLRTALRAPDNFGMLLATGITAQVTLQALLNTAVAVAMAPPTGVTLPFISYGGSSLVTLMGGIGILLSVSRARGQMTSDTSSLASSLGPSGQSAYARSDFRWRDRGTRVSGAGSGRTTPASQASRGRSANQPRSAAGPPARRTRSRTG